MAIFKTPQEMDRIRKADAILVEAQRRNFVPEAIEYEDKICLVISRCVKGPQGWVGFLRVDEIPLNESNARVLKKASRRRVKDGLYPDPAEQAVGDALRKRLFGRKVKA